MFCSISQTPLDKHTIKIITQETSEVCLKIKWMHLFWIMFSILLLVLRKSGLYKFSILELPCIILEYNDLFNICECFMDSWKQYVPSAHCHSYTCIFMFNVAIVSFRPYYLAYFFLDLQISKGREPKSPTKVC